MKQKSKRFFSAILAIALIFSISTTTFAKTFTDVPKNHWAYSVIDDLSNKGIMNGYSDGAFKPGGTITNAEFATIITNSYCYANGLPLPGKATASQKWYEPVFSMAASNRIITPGQFTGKENSPILRSDMALLVSNAMPKVAVPSDVSTALNKFSDAASIKRLSSSYQNAIAKVANADVVSGDASRNFNPDKTATRAEAATIASNFLKFGAVTATVPKPDETPKPAEGGAIMIAAAASLQNAFEKSLIPEFQKISPNIKVTGTYDSSGKLQTQIEAGLEADIFFSAATKQMTALKDKKLIDASTITNLLRNEVVLIGTSGVKTKVTGFENITSGGTIAVGDPASVPAGQYAQEVFTSLGNWEAVLKKASLGTNVTEVLSWVAAGSADVGVVYATDAASNKDVVVIANAPAGSLKEPVVYPIGITSGSKQKAQAQAFIEFLKSDTAKAIFESYGFTVTK